MLNEENLGQFYTHIRNIEILNPILILDTMGQ